MKQLITEMTLHSLETQAAATLRHIARNEAIKTDILQNTASYSTLLKAALRFIGGETLPQCVETALTLNQQGYATTIDYMGESTRSATEVQQVTEEFLGVIRAIDEEHLKSSVSLDLSHVGLAIDADLAYENASIIATAARTAGLEVTISMEGSERTADILKIHQRLCDRFDNVGITLQAALYRTKEDLASALERPGKIRLVKGAYEEPADVARTSPAEVSTAYGNLMEILLSSGHICSIATHDPVMLDRAHQLIQSRRLDCKSIEFEMLKGIAPERLKTMQDRGYRTRVYLPYGREWYLYLCHRLAEHPPNLYQALIDAAGARASLEQTVRSNGI